MNCLECGNKTNNPKFCSPSCSAFYTNRLKVDKCVNKHKTKEISCIECTNIFSVNIRAKNNRKCFDCLRKFECKSCKCQITENVSYCIDCKFLAKSHRFYVKLGITDKNYKIAFNKALEIINLEYNGNKKSSLQISKEYNISNQLFFSFCKRFNIKTRSFSQALKLTVTEGRFIYHNSSGTQYRTGLFTTKFGETYWYRSSYELRMMKIFDSSSISYSYESKRIPYVFNNTGSIYLPDFYLPDFNLIVETKGEYFQEIDKDKIEAKRQGAINNGYKYIMIGNNDLLEFENDLIQMKKKYDNL